MFTSIYLFRKWRNAFPVLVFGSFLLTPGGVFGAAVSASVSIQPYSVPADCKQALDKKAVPAKVSFTTIDALLQQSFFPFEKDTIALSPVCAFSVSDSLGSMLSKQAVKISFVYSETPYRPRIYEWSESAKQWRALATKMNRTTRTVSVDIKKSTGILAVIADGRDSYEGVASWYAHKRYPQGSATNIFPIGTKLKVINTANYKSTTVTVTSTWTNKNEKRIIDLVSTAFKKIAALSDGLIPIRIERL